MPVNSDLFDALSSVTGVDGVFDTKLPDGYVLTGTILAYQAISDTPEVAIDGAIVHRDGRWQVSVRSVDLTQARAAKDAVIAALHGYSGPSIARCDFEGCPGEPFESGIYPFQYHIPIDFMVQF